MCALRMACPPRARRYAVCVQDLEAQAAGARSSMHGGLNVSRTRFCTARNDRGAPNKDTATAVADAGAHVRHVRHGAQVRPLPVRPGASLRLVPRCGGCFPTAWQMVTSFPVCGGGLGCACHCSGNWPLKRNTRTHGHLSCAASTAGAGHRNPSEPPAPATHRHGAWEHH